MRRMAVVVLVVLGCVSFTLAAVGVWVRHNVADTEVWVDRAGPLAADPAVQAALGRWLTDEVVDLLDPVAFFEDVLPERGRLLAVPLAGAVEGFVADRIDRFLASDEFQTLWVVANERVHRNVVRLLRGDDGVVTSRDGSVTIDLVPVIDGALAQLSEASPELLGREVDLPELSVDDVPEAAIERLGAALGVDLGDDFGQVTVYEARRLSALQTGIDQARRLLVVSAVAAIACLAGALALSGRRRRTLLQMLAGLAIGIALIRRLGIRSQAELLAGIPDPVNRDAAAAVSNSFLSPLLATTRSLLVVIVLAAAVAVVTGPYPRAVRLRAATAGAARRLADETRGEWVAAHRGGLQAAGIAVGAAALVLLDLSFIGMAVVAAMVVVYELAVSGPRSSDRDDAPGPQVGARSADTSV